MLAIPVRLVGRRNSGGSHGLNERQVLHGETERIGGCRDHGGRSCLSIDDSSEEDLWTRTGSDSTTHVVRQERQTDLIRSVHPTKTFTGYHLEIDPLVTVFRINQMREFYCVKLREKNSQDIFPKRLRRKIRTFSGTTPLKSTNAVVIMYRNL